MNWVEITYRPVTLFRLRPANLTDAGIQSLLVPTYWAVRVAFLAQSYRQGGLARAKQIFPLLKDIELRISPPPGAVKTITCWRGMSWKEKKKSKRKDMDQPIERNGFGLREFVDFQGDLRIALGGMPETLAEILPLATGVNYFGKWGGFFQFVSMNNIDMPDTNYARPLNEGNFNGGIMHELDEWGKGLTYEMIDAYSPAKPRSGKERLFIPVVLPYRVRYGPEGVIYYRWGDEDEV
jgi:hypothetical protein